MLLFIVLFMFLARNSIQRDSINRNQSLSGDEKLMSEGGQFILGFFKPGNSSYYYIGIWYKNIPQLTPVWVANRNTPVNDPKKNKLIISNNGNLVLVNDSGNSHVWSTNLTSNAASYAVLLDTGNFVLRENQNTTTNLWQSFDHQTNTWLPGSKLGVDKVHGNNVQHLISWKSLDDPSYGSYSLAIDPSGTKQFFITWNNSVNYWSSGIWNGDIFSNVPEMVAHYLYNFEYVSNDEEDYFTYSLQANVSLVSRFIIDVSGQIKQLTWVEEMKQWTLFWAQPKQQCQVYALCGPFASCNEDSYPSFCNCIRGFRQKSIFNMGSGCVRNYPLHTGKNSSDWFLAMYNMRMPDAAITLKLANVTSSLHCEHACLSNHSCNAYSYAISTGCSMWCSSLLNLQEQYTGPGSGTLFIRLAASEFAANMVNSSKSGNAFIIKVIVGATVGGILALALTVSITMYFCILKTKREGSSKFEIGEGGLVAYRYSYLQKVSKNFSDKIGEGGFGSVFKGILPADSTEVAIKKLQGVRQGEKQFRAEVSTIGTIQHVNLVRLHGFCSEGQNRLLVYEYMPNGSLQTQLFKKGANSSVIINWDTRYQIALGIARGLTYLHNHCRDCIIHCDIKPENILLDECFVPKVADFGLAKLLGRDLSRVLTTMRGTMGYLAPEWISGLPITPKADVYSYGMMLFEIISGKRNLQLSADDDEPHFFPAMAAAKLMEGEVMGLLDDRLEGIAKLEEVIRISKVACWCIQDDEHCRPTMLQVLQILEGVVQVNMPPIPKVLHMFASNGDISTPNFFSELSTVASVRSLNPNSSSTD